ncbi:MAG: hypothetical protein ACREQQ_10760 [Candidatus Binatia bacterium]
MRARPALRGVFVGGVDRIAALVDRRVSDRRPAPRRSAAQVGCRRGTRVYFVPWQVGSDPNVYDEI